MHATRDTQGLVSLWILPVLEGETHMHAHAQMHSYKNASVHTAQPTMTIAQLHGLHIGVKLWAYFCIECCTPGCMSLLLH